MDEAVFKPTNKEPVSDQSKAFEKNFKKTMVKNNVQLNEVDGLLTEKEQSLKKKIFSLAKMESLVFADPKLTAVYDGMAENGEEKYGYHYNETIQNMIFNDYVLNSPKYLQKYKMAIPKEKKRRDKSGINKLKKAGAEKMGKSGANLSNAEPKAADLKEMEQDTEKTKVVFLVHNDDPDVFAYFPELPHSTKYMTGYAHIGQHTAVDPNYANECREAKPEEYQVLQAELESLGYNLEVLNGMQESTTAGSAGGAHGYVGYAGPAAWKKGGGDLMEDGKTPIMRKPIQMITAMHENYLTESNYFEKMFLDLNEEAKSKSQQRFFGMVDAVKKGELSPDKAGEKVAKAAKDMTDDDVEDFASTKHKGLPEKVDEENENKKYLGKKEDNNIKEDTQTMANKPNQDNPETMANTMDSSSMESGMNTMNEGDRLLEEIENELTAYSIHQDKLKKIAEDRKTTSMVLGDRVRAENPKNFSKDLQHSGTKEIINVEKELEWKDQQTDVPKDPQKLGLDIEKKELKVTDAEGDEALKNVGNSANDKGDEIPKRNLTDEETDEVDLYRKGLGDFVFDNKPDERFEDRMKADMGDKLYKKRQDTMEFEAKRPLYNKDPQPIGKTPFKKVEYDKEAEGWGDRMGKELKESMVTGKFIGIHGKTNFIDFKMNEITEIESMDEGFVLHLDGLGNIYNSKVEINENLTKVINEHEFRTDGKKVFVLKKQVQSLNEDVKKEEKSVVNEEFGKMKHLLGYKPDNYVNTQNTKNNRGF